MLFHRGTPVWEELNSFFVNADRLLLFLKNHQFTGYVKIQDNDVLYLILIDEGDVVAAASKEVTDKIGIPMPVNDILAAAAASDESSTLSIYELSTELAGIFTKIYHTECEVLHKDLHSDFSDIPKFLEKMQSTHFSGYIHFDFIKIDKHGIIVLEEGKVTSLLSHKIELTESDPDNAKTKLMNMIISESNINGAVFNIYQFAD
ncbi:MAG: hypothetical protein D3926_09695 [Desulfobacteraceae bacterium]|nr:MAG: hypothetical protein D3926_09695 [Desulfobacteraceae bacterium]